MATKTRHSRQSRSFTVTCPLADPEIGIISENDHRVGLCLCHFCTCGRHMCPYQQPKQYLPYKSKYRVDYPRKAFDTPLKSQPRQFVPNSQKMDLKTTHTTDYVAFAVKPNTTRPAARPVEPLEMVTRSTYGANFPNWGPSGVKHEKEWHPPVRSTELPFKGNSYYRVSYQDLPPKDSNALMRTFTANKDNVQFGPRDVYAMRTTYGEAMQDFSDVPLNRRYRPRCGQPRRLSVSPTHFTTTTGDVYKPKGVNAKDPRHLRFALLSRG